MEVVPLGPDVGRRGAASAEGEPDRVPALRPRPRRRRRRGRLLRRAHHAARRPGHPRPAHRRAAGARRGLLPAQGGHFAKIGPPLSVQREGRLRDDVASDHPGPRPSLRGADPHGPRAVAPDAAELAVGSSGSTERTAGCAMKVSIISPYSLSAPGGVQGQVLGLARALRKLGVDARVIGPCDGPPPEPGVISVGPSVKYVSNGSISPMAQAQKLASERTLEALRSFQPDVVHLHEPLVPGPTGAALLGADGPMVGTFHAAGEDGHPAYRALKKVAVASRASADDPHRGLGRRRAGWPKRRSAASTSCCRTASTSSCSRRRNPTPTRATRGAVPRPPRAAQGLGVLLDAWAGLDRDAVLWVASDGPETKALRDRRTPNVEWLGRITDAREGRPAEGRDRVLRAVARPGVVRHRAARGDGGRHRGARVGHPGLRERRPAGTRKRCSSRPAIPRRCAPGCGASSTPTGCAATSIEAGEQRVGEFSLTRLAERYLPVYETAIAVGTASDARVNPHELAARGRGARARRRVTAPRDARRVRDPPGGTPRWRSTRSPRPSAQECRRSARRHRVLRREDRGLRGVRHAERDPRRRSDRRLAPDRGRHRVVLRVGRRRCPPDETRDARRRLVRRRPRAQDRAAVQSPSAARARTREEPDGDRDPDRARPTTPISTRSFWTAALRGRPSLPMTIVLEELVDRSGMRGGYFDLGSATFNTTRIVTGSSAPTSTSGADSSTSSPRPSPRSSRPATARSAPTSRTTSPRPR